MKSDYTIKIIDKKSCSSLLEPYHYLSNISKGFKSGVNYGLYSKDEVLVGVAIFTGFPVPELVKGCYGLPRNEQEGFYELSRLVLHPFFQKTEHNLASWFLSRAMRLLRRNYKVRAILSYADEGFHEGIVYKASNFKYYGLTDKKKDFWIKDQKGGFVKHSRGKTKGVEGEWRPRNRKHRFLITYDKTLKCLWEEEQ